MSNILIVAEHLQGRLNGATAKCVSAALALNPDGIRIPFGSSDIKALVSYYYANGFISNTHQMGRRCYEDGNRSDCEEDLNAGAFHIVLVNKIALRNEGIIIDLKRGLEVWNHPIIRTTRCDLRTWDLPAGEDHHSRESR